jgi:hypothetical protein
MPEDILTLGVVDYDAIIVSASNHSLQTDGANSFVGF